MTEDHLTDEQIQKYLDNKGLAESSLVNHHLRICPQCRQQVALYRELYTTLEEEVVSDLPAGFADRIIRHLSMTGQSRWEKLESGFIVALTLIAFAVTAYFVNPLPLLVETTKSLWQGLPSLSPGFLSKLNGNLPLILIAVLILILVELFDKKLLKHHIR